MAEVDWDRTVFVLICPDGVARQHSFTILNALAAADLTPLAWRVLWHRPDGLDSFHERNIASAWQAYRYRLVDQLFAFGPSVALLMADQGAGSGPDPHTRLRLLKGPSDPAQADPGTIRGDLHSINAMLSLLHSADSPADSASESAVFAGVDGFTGDDCEGLSAALGLLEASKPREQRDYPEVVAGLRAKALAAAWPQLPRPLRKTAAALLEAGPAELAAPGTGERLASLLDPAHPLASLIGADFTPAAPGPDPDRVAATLAGFGAAIDEWERLVLATSRRFWPRWTLQFR